MKFQGAVNRVGDPPLGAGLTGGSGRQECSCRFPGQDPGHSLAAVNRGGGWVNVGALGLALLFTLQRPGPPITVVPPNPDGRTEWPGQ